MKQIHLFTFSRIKLDFRLDCNVWFFLNESDSGICFWNDFDANKLSDKNTNRAGIVTKKKIKSPQSQCNGTTNSKNDSLQLAKSFKLFFVCFWSTLQSKGRVIFSQVSFRLLFDRKWNCYCWWQHSLSSTFI